MKLKVIKDKYHVKIETPNGARYSIPIEVIRGMMAGEIESKYENACEFLNAEDKGIDVNVDKIKKIFEENI